MRCPLRFLPAAIVHTFITHVSATSPDEVALLQARMGHHETRHELAGSLPEERLANLIKEAQTPGSHSDLFRQPMINFGDAQYVSYMNMGKQMIAGIIDTGSFELVVFGSDCRSCSVAAHYNHHFSESYEMGTLRTQMNYGSGSTLCDESFEQVSIGPYDSKKQMFWEVIDAQMPILMNAAFEAIIGVGPTEAQLVQIWNDMGTYIKNLTGYYDRGMSAPPEAVSYAKQMVEAGVQLGTELPMLHSLKVPFFSICMGSEPRSDGVIVWNDTLAFDQPDLFVTLPVLSDHTWSALLTEPTLRFEGRMPLQLGCENGCTAIIDSGTSLLGAPSKIVKTIMDAMNLLDVNCSNLEVLPDLEFSLGGAHFSLPPSAIVAEVVGEATAMCIERSCLNCSRRAEPVLAASTTLVLQ